MLNTRFDDLPEYPFPRLRALLGGLAAKDPEGLNMSVGEPQHAVPEFVAEILHRERASYNRYPPVAGTPEWQAAMCGWFCRRYNMADDILGPDHVLPLPGSREGLFSIGQVVLPRQKHGHRPAVLMPNPFYQPYAAAALSAGAEPVYVTGTRAQNFLPEYEKLPKALLRRVGLAFLCSPANPQGSVADLAYLKRQILLARRYDYVLVGDECYSEIYDQVPPPGILEACLALVKDGKAEAADPFRNVLCFNSLSKRSNLAGLRSAVVAGDPQIIRAFARLRSYGGTPLPLPVLAASAAAWADEGHVQKNRDLYRQKFDLAEKYLAGRFDFARPQGGFCLWLNVGDGEAATRRLWSEAGIKVLPGAYLAREGEDGTNPALSYIRLVLVHDNDRLEAALEKIAAIL